MFYAASLANCFVALTDYILEQNKILLQQYNLVCCCFDAAVIAAAAAAADDDDDDDGDDDDDDAMSFYHNVVKAEHCMSTSIKASEVKPPLLIMYMLL